MKTVAELENDSKTSPESLRRIAVAKTIVEPILTCGKNISEIRLFGKVARGMATEGSDIDINVIAKGSLSPSQRIEITDIIGTTLQKAGHRVMAHYQWAPRIQIPLTIDFGVYPEMPTDDSEKPVGPEEEQVILFRK